MKTILAAIDFSPVTKRVVEEARVLALGSKGRLVILNVTGPKALVKDRAALEAVISHGGASRAKGASPVPGDSLQLVGDPATTILEQARAWPADYIVMGSHGRRAWLDALMGGTAGKVMAGAKCPVILVPARLADRHGVGSRASYRAVRWPSRRIARRRAVP
jgi:nucleotide-binding universal stress UspA family protein